MTKSTPERVNILNEASELIVGRRQDDYGTPQENFQRMADFANILFAKNLETNMPISARQTADFMILLKVARTINSPTRDSYVDIAGYAGIAGELSNPDQPTLPHEDLQVDGTIDLLDIGPTINVTINPVHELAVDDIGKAAQAAVERYLAAFNVAGGMS